MMRRRFLQLVAAFIAFLFRPLPALAYDGTISGNFAGTIPAGQNWHVTGNVNQIGDVFVEGLVTGIDTFYWQGNGFSVFFQNGGRANLAGKVKARWTQWGGITAGWVAGDRLAVAPTAAGVYVPSELVWSDWSMARPVNSPDVTLVDGTIAKPEVVNLSQSIVFENLARGFHFHDSAGVQSLSDVKFLNCGTTGVLGNYPVHFHLLGDNSRGSLLERVVVEGGKNHAFVPHGSHGISFPGCVAYNTTGVAFWWDKPPQGDAGNTVNDSDDIRWDDCLSMWSKPSTMSGESIQLAGFWLGAGINVSCDRSVATCIPGKATSGSRARAGFHWPENAGRTSWSFHDSVAHNIAENGLSVWQNNTSIENHIERFVSYRVGFMGVNHGAYTNRYQYLGASLSGAGFLQRAKSAGTGPLNVEDVLSDAPLVVGHHNSTFMGATFFRRCTFPQVVYSGETQNGSYNRYEDCGLVPADFDMSGASAQTIAEVYETGVLMHRWQSGIWS